MPRRAIRKVGAPRKYTADPSSKPVTAIRRAADKLEEVLQELGDIKTEQRDQRELIINIGHKLDGMRDKMAVSRADSRAEKKEGSAFLGLKEKQVSLFQKLQHGFEDKVETIRKQLIQMVDCSGTFFHIDTADFPQYYEKYNYVSIALFVCKTKFKRQIENMKPIHNAMEIVAACADSYK